MPALCREQVGLPSTCVDPPTHETHLAPEGERGGGERERGREEGRERGRGGEGEREEGELV